MWQGIPNKAAGSAADQDTRKPPAAAPHPPPETWLQSPANHDPVPDSGAANSPSLPGKALSPEPAAPDTRALTQSAPQIHPSIHASGRPGRNHEWPQDRTASPAGGYAPAG